ncbi:hypothetical protein CK203_022004 [Vitis vinifera]|uniref:Uncharacterized protein n=1 Tax=Vitis vinifera TaxID=29760 RepID=A0A438JFK9_VITVI|nr:hypothetical protein CK203_022004 [Vitis vinifera]
MVSSANCKWEIVVLLLPTVKPSNNLLFLTLNINLLSTSATILKRKGDSGSPCLKSLGALTQPLALPFTGIAKEREDKPLIQTRKATQVSIAEAADAIGIPRMLIDIRHGKQLTFMLPNAYGTLNAESSEHSQVESDKILVGHKAKGSHRDLPSLRLVRLASVKALDWLKSYYWEPQKKAIPLQRDGSSNIRKEIKSKIRELAFCLKVRQSSRSGGPLAKGKRITFPQQAYLARKLTLDRNQEFQIMPLGNRIEHLGSNIAYKDFTKKALFLDSIHITLSFSPLFTDFPCKLEKRDFTGKGRGNMEIFVIILNSQKCVVHHCAGKHGELLCGSNKFFSVMTGKLLSSNSGVPKKQITRILKNLVLLYSSYSSERTDNMQTVFDDWKLLLTKFSNKEPELPLTLLKAVLDMIGTQEAMKIEIGGHHLISSEDDVEIGQIELLSSLFAWLVEHFKGFYSEIQIPKATLLELLRKCLLVSAPDNKLIMGSALLLAQMAENNIMIEKLSRFCLLGLSKSDVTEETAPPLSFEKLLVHQEDAIRQAAEKLELVKRHRVKGSIVKTTTNGDDGNHSRWVVAKSWNPCPIGMLPRALGSSGRLPALDHNDNQKMPQNHQKEGSCGN